MGAVNSCCIPTKNPNFQYCKENHSTPKVKGHRRNLSAAFNLTELGQEVNVDQLNINSATEEMLMTLPGINRATAHNIVEYRRQIGGFRKVEDLALVSGVGATRLNLIRLEICVDRKKNSKNSTPSGSKQDLSINENRMYQKNALRMNSVNGASKVNVNSSNVFQLMKVKGIGQTLAENIVTYRDKKGFYKSLDDLVKVRGFGPALLSAIRHHLMLEESDSPRDASHMNGSIPNSSLNNTSPTSSSLSKTLSDSQEEFLSLFNGPFRRSVRPKVTPFYYKRDNKPAIRIATWNIQQCGLEKTMNPGVREVICRTILENGLSLLAFQELADKDALQQICEELNNPTLPSVQKWVANRGTWSCVTSAKAGRMFQSMEYNGFLYDTSQGLEFVSSSLLEKTKSSDKQFARQPYIGMFKVNKLDFVVVSVHLKAAGLNEEDLARLQEEIMNVPKLSDAIEEHLPGEGDIIIMGDFNEAPDSQEFDTLRNRGYLNMVSASTYTNISTKNLDGSKSFDNIWLSPQAQHVFTGRCGVVREGICHPWIPDGWSWGGTVSDHCPVWAELFTNKDLDSTKGDFMHGVEGISFTARVSNI